MREETRKESKRLSASFAASVTVHLLLALFITVMYEHEPQPKKRSQVMDVVLLKPSKPAKTPPKDAKTLSTQNAEGGSSKAQDKLTRAARAPVSGERPSPLPTPPQQPKTPPPTPDEPNRTRLLTKRGPQPEPKPSNRQPQTKKPKPTHQPVKPVPLSNLMPSTTALAQLSRDFQRERRMKQLMKREADIPINTRQAKYAPYAQALVRALEEQWRPGQANYSAYSENERKALLRLTIEHNGDLGGVEILRPSPIQQINESAIKAVHDAAPFHPLPSSWGLDRVSFYLTFEVVEDRFVFHAM